MIDQPRYWVPGAQNDFAARAFGAGQPPHPYILWRAFNLDRFFASIARGQWLHLWIDGGNAPAAQARSCWPEWAAADILRRRGRSNSRRPSEVVEIQEVRAGTTHRMAKGAPRHLKRCRRALPARLLRRSTLPQPSKASPLGLIVMP